jgi:hypothetical protein
MPYSLHKSGNDIPDSTRLSASMIWLSVNRDFFISVDPFRWKKFYFSALRIFGGITLVIKSKFPGR